MNALLKKTIKALKEKPEKWTYENIAFTRNCPEEFSIDNNMYISFDDEFFEFDGYKSFLSIWTCNGFWFLKPMIKMFYHQTDGPIGNKFHKHKTQVTLELTFFEKVILWWYVRNVLNNLNKIRMKKIMDEKQKLNEMIETLGTDDVPTSN